MINYYLGEFLENVNYDQLKFQLLSGEISLEHVPIRRGATLRRFGLPIDIRSGSVTSIKISRPSATRFFYDPFIIAVDGIDLAVAPADQAAQAEQEDENGEYERRKQRVEQLIGRLQMVGQQQGLWSSYSSTIVTQIVQNIQVRIENVSIRYKDDEILDDELGFSIAAVNVVNMTAADPNNETAKKMELKSLKCFELDSGRFLLEPVDADVIITKNKSPLPLNGDQARFSIDVSIGDVLLRLSDQQHHQIYSVFEKLDWFRRRQRFSKGRPAELIRNSEEKSDLIRKWWNWVIRVHMEPIEKYHRRSTKQFIMQRVRDINIYKRLVIALLKKETLSEQDQIERDRIEKSWQYDEIKTVIYAAIDQEYKPSEQKNETQERFSHFFQINPMFKYLGKNLLKGAK